MKTMQSKFAGQCRCGCRFHRGETIAYDRTARRVIKCPSCSGRQSELNLADALDMAYEDQCAAACGPGL